MEKILLLINAHNFNPAILDFVSGITEMQKKSKIVGVFLSDQPLTATPERRSVGGQVFVEEITLSQEQIIQDRIKTKQNIALFKEGCSKRGLAAIVHSTAGDPYENIIRESRYADLLIADPKISFSEEDTVPTKFVKNILAHAECPVLVAPEHFEKIDEIVFAYDGSKSSVFAIKQFCYQLPGFIDKKLTVLHIEEPGRSEEIYVTEKGLLEEMFALKCIEFSYATISGDAQDGLFNYFIDQASGNKLLVTGAYGRSVLSTFFRRSAADMVLNATDIPVFIAHLSHN